MSSPCKNRDNAPALRLLDHPHRQQADGVSRAREGGFAPDARAAAADQCGGRAEVVRARADLGFAGGRTGRAEAAAGRRGEARARVAPGRDAQGSPRSVQEEARWRSPEVQSAERRSAPVANAAEAAIVRPTR